jgi:hypothetical protein
MRSSSIALGDDRIIPKGLTFIPLFGMKASYLAIFQSIIFLDHERYDQINTEAIETWPEPMNKLQLQQFLRVDTLKALLV